MKHLQKWYYLLSWLILALAEDLPGVVDLSCGFDALKMAGTNQISAGDQSKFRLFDLNEMNPKKYSLRVDDQEKEFPVPLLVQVRDVGIESHQGVETISRTFEQFFRSYFSSFKFDINVPIPISGQPLNVALSVHTTARRVFELLRTTYKAVATSTTWWGIYSIQMAPSYMLKFDPLFNRSLSKLVPNPSTERHQQFYNEIVNTYGTHYVSSVIIGGVAHMYTFITQEWLKDRTEQETATQVSIGVSYAGFGTDFGIGGGVAVGVQTDTFLKNSMTMSVFSPPILSAPSESVEMRWKAWVKNTARHPAVVNRTLVSLASLLIDYPTAIAEHLQATIDCYLETGQLPKLDDVLRMHGKRRLSIPSPIPGSDVVGCGYDITKLESKMCLFDQTYNDSNIWADVYNGMKSYSVPDGYFVQGSRELYSTYDTVFFNSYEEFVQNSIYIIERDDQGFLGLGSSHERKEIADRLRHIYEYHFRLAWTKRQVVWYKLTLVTFPQLRLSGTAQQALNGLPIVFNPNATDIWKMFFESYGTHYVVSAAIGGLLWAEDYFESCMVTKYSETWIKSQIKRGYWFFSTTEFNQQHTSSMSVEYEKYRTFKLLAVGGVTEETIDSNTFHLNTWMSTLKDRPQPITYHLRPIYTLLPRNSSRRKALEEATAHFRSHAFQSMKSYINRLAALETPPPVPKMNCSLTNRNRRSVKRFDLAAARAALCPIVGYYGQQCPGVSNKTLPRSRRAASQSPQNLPHGVGMGFDLTTGTLLLPALNFTYDGSTQWTDPKTSQVFYIPNEVSLTPTKSEMSEDVNIRLFKTEIELIDVWKKTHSIDDPWLGGEFGFVKNVSDLYDKYFKDGRIVAINQKATMLYALEMKSSDQPNSLRLNKYAQSAIDQLTAETSNDVYRSFIEAWGTHIIVSTRIGGMMEQQVSLRECILADDTLMNSGMTLDKLRKDLTEELVSTLPCVSHYYFIRRKKLSDRLIGGKIDANTTSDWYNTLALDPALLRIDKYIPWYEFLPVGALARTKLEEAINKYISEAEEERRNQAQRVQEQRGNMTIPASYAVYLKQARSEQNDVDQWAVEQIASIGPRSGSVTLNTVTACPTGMANENLASQCSIGQQISACALANIDNAWTFTTNVPLTYERNTTTAAFRLVARRVHGVITNNETMEFRNYDAIGHWTHVGCSVIVSNCSSYRSDRVSFMDRQAFLCVGCDLTCTEVYPGASNLKRCTCNCPPFPSDKPYEPYCK